MSALAARGEETRLEAWADELERRAAELRARAERLRDDTAVCIQIEASLVELAHDNEAMGRAQAHKERQLADARQAVDRQHDAHAAALAQCEEQLRSQRDAHEEACRVVDHGWHAAEDGAQSHDAAHAHELARTKRAQRELEDREAMLRERLRAASDEEQRHAARLRQLRGRERLVDGIARAALDRLLAELREREALLLLVDHAGGNGSANGNGAPPE